VVLRQVKEDLQGLGALLVLGQENLFRLLHPARPVEGRQVLAPHRLRLGAFREGAGEAVGQGQKLQRGTRRVGQGLVEHAEGGKGPLEALQKGKKPPKVRLGHLLQPRVPGPGEEFPGQHLLPAL
jgi:hypothetical protein